MIYAPRFHCELQLSIERAWGTSKDTCREECDYTITSLRKNVPMALDKIKPEMFRQWQRTEMVYEEAYRGGATILTVEGEVRRIKGQTYKSHRVVPPAPTKQSKKRKFEAIDAKKIAEEVDMELEPEPKHKEWVREMLPLWDDEGQTVCRLVHVAWNSEVGKLVGWFYECASATDPMPMRGRYLDIDRCLYAPVDDVQEMHEEYLVKQEAKTLPWG